MLSPEPEFLKILESIYMLSYIYAKSNKKFRPCKAILYKIYIFSTYMLIFSAKFHLFGKILYIC